MRKEIYKALTAAVVLTISGGMAGGVQATDTILDPVYVYGTREISADAIPGEYQNKKGPVGILGVKDTMDIPFQQINLAQKTINTFAATPSEQSVNVLVNVPSVRNSGSTLYNDFSIRGIGASAYQFRVNAIRGYFHRLISQ